MNKDMATIHYFAKIFFKIFCGTLCLCSTLYAKNVVSTKIPVLHIQTHTLSPIQIGLAIGEQSKNIFPDIESRYDAYLEKTFNQTQFKHIVQYRLPMLLKQIDTSYQEEMRGVMGAWTLTTQRNRLGDGLLSTDEYLVLNLLSDIGLVPNGSGFGAFAKATKAKKTLVGRNTDWKSTSDLRSLQAITVYHNKDKQFVNIGFAGLVSILTGFNEQGLFVSYLNAEPYTPYTEAYNIKNATPLALNKNPRKTIFAVRNVLENAKTIKAATYYLSKTQFSAASNLLIADKNSVQVLEFSADRRMQVRQWNDETHRNKPWNAAQQIAVVDCHVLADLPNNCHNSQDTYRWQRWHELAKFNDQQPLDEKKLSTLLFDTQNDGNEIFNASTLNSLIFIPEHTMLYLYTAPVDNEVINNLIHQPYLNLLPPAKDTYAQIYVSIWQLIWVIILILIIITTVWVYKLPKKHPK